MEKILKNTDQSTIQTSILQLVREQHYLFEGIKPSITDFMLWAPILFSICRLKFISLGILFLRFSRGFIIQTHIQTTAIPMTILLLFACYIYILEKKSLTLNLEKFSIFLLVRNMINFYCYYFNLVKPTFMLLLCENMYPALYDYSLKQNQSSTNEKESFSMFDNYADFESHIRLFQIGATFMIFVNTVFGILCGIYFSTKIKFSDKLNNFSSSYEIIINVLDAVRLLGIVYFYQHVEELIPFHIVMAGLKLWGFFYFKPYINLKTIIMTLWYLFTDLFISLINIFYRYNVTGVNRSYQYNVHPHLLIFITLLLLSFTRKLSQVIIRKCIKINFLDPTISIEKQIRGLSLYTNYYN